MQSSNGLDTLLAIVIDLMLVAHAFTLSTHGNYARAAEALRISQPALSRQIVALEASLGVRLFDRSRRGVEPTAFGRLLLQRAGTLLSDAAELERQIGMIQGLEVGELRVAGGMYAAELSLGTALGRLTAKHPGLRVEVTTGDWRSILRAVIDRELDLAIAELSEIQRDPRLLVEPLPRHPGVFYCRSGHPLLRQKAPTLKRVFAFPFVGPNLVARLGDPMSAALRRGEAEPGKADYPPPIQVDTVRLAKDIVASSDAFSIAPLVSIAADVRAGRLVALPPRPAWLHTNYGFVYARNRTLSPAAKAFMAEFRIVEAEIVAEAQRLAAEGMNGRRPAPTRARRAP